MLSLAAAATVEIFTVWSDVWNVGGLETGLEVVSFLVAGRMSTATPHDESNGNVGFFY